MIDLADGRTSKTVQYDRVMFILEPNEITRALPRKKAPARTDQADHMFGAN